MRIKDLELADAKLTLGLLLPEELPDIAIELLEKKYESPSLLILAGLNKSEVEESRALFNRLIAELNVTKVSRREAVKRLARENAKDILAEKVSPYQGAKKIWRLSLCLDEVHPTELDSFIYGASEWEDRPEERHVFEAGIVAAARELLDLSFGS